GTTADSLGRFAIADVPVGRYDVKAGAIGYEETVVREIILISAKQSVISIGLAEASKALEEVTVRAGVDKQQGLNSMATVSARMLS
ncbi:carboxypeptidase-like regulatory domain-containing protein, partial [Salmonella enterica]|uniref:carboxypeptidase-like regulatory domain-containing protein n=1 Tax=Salmonella enterica TaxID=28901 RepID=UPI0020A48D10